jgi:hypothetical protein
MLLPATGGNSAMPTRKTHKIIRVGLPALEESNGVVEHWLRTDVLHSYKELQADPSRIIPAEKVFANVRDQLAYREKAVPCRK